MNKPRVLVIGSQFSGTFCARELKSQCISSVVENQTGGSKGLSEGNSYLLPIKQFPVFSTNPPYGPFAVERIQGHIWVISVLRPLAGSLLKTFLYVCRESVRTRCYWFLCGIM